MNCRSICYISILLLLGIPLLSAQTNTDIYWIAFSNKNNTPYSLSNPGEFLTQRAIDRRIRQQIPITEQDLPVDPAYINAIENIGAHVLNTSKWFNGAIVAIKENSLLEQILNLPFVTGTPVVLKRSLFQPEKLKNAESKLDIGQEFSPDAYGNSYNQLAMLRGDVLHREGYRGQGMLIAVLDAGFDRANQIYSLQHLYTQNKIIATRDFVQQSPLGYNTHNHGTIVLSIMAGILPGELYGTAPEASYILARTEDAGTEFLIEEYNWICGAEFADSLGADVINTSLGYSVFNDASQNHTYSDMDGETAPITIASDIAASKGMVIVTSAGNEGTSDWYYISAPGDAKKTLTVGAVDSAGLVVGFSSHGPTADGRIKPDICAQGFRTVSQSPSGALFGCSGTSCSSPVMAGMAACLWQAYPTATADQIVEFIRKSADRYFTPDYDYGFGIPDFGKLSMLHEEVNQTSGINETIQFYAYPNPTEADIYLHIKRTDYSETEAVAIKIYNTLGQLQYEQNRNITGNNFVLNISDVAHLSKGVYFVIANISGKQFTHKIQKL